MDDLSPPDDVAASKWGKAPLSNSRARLARAFRSARRRSSNLWQRYPTKRRESGVRISAAAAQMGAWTSTTTEVDRASMFVEDDVIAIMRLDVLCLVYSTSIMVYSTRRQ